MLNDNLFDEILMAPAYHHGADNLRILSGFASDSLARHHIERLATQNLSVKVELIIGMTPLQGLEENHHDGFCQLTELRDDTNVQFRCSYLQSTHPDHSKVYCWLKNGVPVFGFVGSANYSITAFLSQQRETMAVCDPDSANRYYLSSVESSVLCCDKEASSLITIHTPEKLLYPRIDVQVPDGPSIRIPLILKTGQTPAHSGINWGQRKGRNSDQAYLALPVALRESGFFPEIGVRFSVVADDGWEVEMSRAQQSGKGVHTPLDNSALGRYLRSRLGLNSGEFVTRQHLESYGRTDVEFSKITDNVYYLNFRKP